MGTYLLLYLGIEYKSCISIMSFFFRKKLIAFTMVEYVII